MPRKQIKLNVPNVLSKKILKSTASRLSGSITQQAEDRSFKPTVEGSTPSGPTNRLIAKKCDCGIAMYLHRIDNDVKFIECEPCVIDIRISDISDHGLVIRGKRSTKNVTCKSCGKKHAIRTFSEV